MHTILETVREAGERAVISRITARLQALSAEAGRHGSLSPSGGRVLVGPGDDAAVVETPRRTLSVLTTDALVEGVHFDHRFCPAEAIGHKALAVSLSDLAAMGATPHWALMSLVLPDDLALEDLDALVEGMLTLAQRHKVIVVGGNVTRSGSCHGTRGHGPLVVDVTAVGAVAPRRILTRAGAKPGDEVWVTGSLGGGVVGLEELRGATGAPVRTTASERYLRPEPRVRAGILLGRNRAATACMDLSDGLADAVRQIGAASGVGMIVNADSLPIDDSVRRWCQEHGRDPTAVAAGGGDDYELLFTVRPSHRSRLRTVFSQSGKLAFTKVGVVTKDRKLVLRTAEGDRGLPEGFEHFRDGQP